MVALPHPLPAQQRESLPFVVRPARSRPDLRKVAMIRHQAYGRHLPEFAATLQEPEAADFDEGTIVLLAEAKSDGRPVGTARIQTNRSAPLPLEGSFELPDWLQGKALVEVTRLGVEASAIGHLAKLALFKACYRQWLADGIDWAVIAARSPLDTLYEGLLFRDVPKDGRAVNMRHIGNLPHRVMALSVPRARDAMFRYGHPMYSYAWETEHPDIRLDDVNREPVFAGA